VKRLLIGMLFLVLFVLPICAYPADCVQGTGVPVLDGGKTTKISIPVTCTADGSGVFANLTITLPLYKAWWLYQLDIDPGNTTKAPSAVTINIYRLADYTLNTTNALALCTASAASVTATTSRYCGSSTTGYFWPGESLVAVVSQAGNTPAASTLKFTLQLMQ
jgi:hypothetical protein